MNENHKKRMDDNHSITIYATDRFLDKYDKLEKYFQTELTFDKLQSLMNEILAIDKSNDIEKTFVSEYLTNLSANENLHDPYISLYLYRYIMNQIVKPKDKIYSDKYTSPYKYDDHYRGTLFDLTKKASMKFYRTNYGDETLKKPYKYNTFSKFLDAKLKDLDKKNTYIDRNDFLTKLCFALGINNEDAEYLLKIAFNSSGFDERNITEKMVEYYLSYVDKIPLQFLYDRFKTIHDSFIHDNIILKMKLIKYIENNPFKFNSKDLEDELLFYKKLFSSKYICLNSNTEIIKTYNIVELKQHIRKQYLDLLLSINDTKIEYSKLNKQILNNLLENYNIYSSAYVPKYLQNFSELKKYLTQTIYKEKIGIPDIEMIVFEKIAENLTNSIPMIYDELNIYNRAYNIINSYNRAKSDPHHYSLVPNRKDFILLLYLKYYDKRKNILSIKRKINSELIKLGFFPLDKPVINPQTDESTDYPFVNSLFDKFINYCIAKKNHGYSLFVFTCNYAVLNNIYQKADCEYRNSGLNSNTGLIETANYLVKQRTR